MQLALLRHPGTVLANLDQSPEPLVIWLATQLGIPAAAFAAYARRPQTMTDHARRLAMTLELRAPVAADWVPMIEAAAQAAWATDRGQPIVAAVIAALRTAGIILPPAAVIERAAIAGRARARKRATDALLVGVTEEQLAKLDRLLVLDGSVGMTPFAWLKAMPIAPKADHVGELLDRLGRVREIGLPPDISERAAAERLRQFVREGYAADAHQLGRYTAHRRRAILITTAADLESRLTDAVLDMADKLIGGVFARARNATRQRYVASAADIGRLMLLFHGTIEALVAAQENDTDVFEAVDDAVGWPKLLHVRQDVRVLAGLASEDPLVPAADRWKTLHKFAPALIAALEFRTARANNSMLAALNLLRDLSQSGKRRYLRMRRCRSARRGENWSCRTHDQTAGWYKRLFWQRCATSCAREMSGSSVRPITAASTAICCRQPRCRRLWRSLACRYRRMNGWPPADSNSTNGSGASPRACAAARSTVSKCVTRDCTSRLSRRPHRPMPAASPTGLTHCCQPYASPNCCTM